MVRTLLVRGMLAGLLAGLVYAAFAYVFGEPSIEAAIAYEDRVAAAPGEVPGVELVGRGVQSTVGLLVAAMVFGVAVGGILAVVHAGVHGRVGNQSSRTTAAVLALTGFVVIYLVPFLKYPANPPASSVDGTISQRTGLYLLMIVVSVVLAIGATLLGRRLAVRWGAWNATQAAVGTYLVAVGIVAHLLPTVDETPADFPATVLYDFRLASIGAQLALWATIGLVLGALVDRRSQRAAERAIDKPTW